MVKLLGGREDTQQVRRSRPAAGRRRASRGERAGHGAAAARPRRARGSEGEAAEGAREDGRGEGRRSSREETVPSKALS
jgi:hypothetical protein